MAKNVLTHYQSVAAAQTNLAVKDPGTGVSLIIDWIQLTVATAAGLVTLQVGDAAATTIIAAANNLGTHTMEFRSPRTGSGMKFDAAAILKISTPAGTTAQVVVGYHLDSN
jgi:hypothetical protein